METVQNIGREVISRLMQYAVAIAGGLLAAFEASIVYAGLCYLAVLIDIISAWCLARRIHRQDPERSDGKFKSCYKFRVVVTLIVIHLALMSGYFVDTLVFEGGKASQNFVIMGFVFYQVWSILENWSSENDNKIARALQRVMVNKAERHLNIEISDILLNDKKEERDDKKNE